MVKMEEIMIICRKCGNKVLSSSLKLDLDEKLMICSDCVKNKKIQKEIKEEVFHKKEENIETKEEKYKIVHKCTSCSYKFKIDPETKIPRNCPYCNARVLSF